jgi:hypothetical protein
MKVYFEKKPDGLVPLHESDQDQFYKIKNGSVFMKDFKLVRMGWYHRRAFKLLNEVYKFQDQFSVFEDFRRRLKWYSGSYIEYMIDDKMITELKSWKFGEMDQMEFEDVFNKISQACLDHFCPCANKAEEQRRVNIVLELSR